MSVKTPRRLRIPSIVFTCQTASETEVSAPTSELSLSAGGRAYTLPRHSVSNPFLSTRSEELIPRLPPHSVACASLREAGFYAPHRSLSTDFFHIPETTQGHLRNTPQQHALPLRRPGSTAPEGTCQPAFFRSSQPSRLLYARAIHPFQRLFTRCCVFLYMNAQGTTAHATGSDLA